MRTLLRKPVRDLRRLKLRSLTVLLMVAMGLGTYAGLHLSRLSLVHTRDQIYQRLRLSDLRVVTTPADPGELPSLEGIPGIDEVEKRLVMPGALEMGDGRPLNCLIVYLDPAARPRVNDLEVLQGGYLSPADKHGVVIERSLAEYHGYRVGDSIVLNPYTAPLEVRVIGVALSPECLIATSDATVFFPLRGSLGVIFASRDLVREVFGYPLYNEFSFRYGRDVEPALAEAAVLSRLGPLGIEDVTRKSEEFAYRFLHESLKGFSAFIPSLVLVFGVVIFLVTTITANRLVVEHRQQIGVLRAMGYRQREVLLSYFLLALLLSLAGGLAGIGLSFGFSSLFAANYARALGLPRVIPVAALRPLVEGWFMTLGVVTLAFAFPLLRLMHLSPQRILRRERREVFTGGPRLLAAAGRMLIRIFRPGIPARYGVRNLFRRSGLTAATVACIALPIALGGAFLVVLYSLDRLTEEMFERETWEVMVNFRYPLPTAAADRILADAGLGAGTSGVTGFGQVVVDGRTLHYQIQGFPADRVPRKLNLVEGRMFRDDREPAILLNRNWRDLAGADFRLGDRVDVRSGDRRASLEIVGLFSDMTVGQAHVPLEIARELFGMGDTVNGVMAPADGPVEQIKQDLYRAEEVSAVYTLREIKDSIREYQAQMQGIIYAATGVSILIAALFLLASVLLNLVERQMEFATLRALGCHRRGIFRIVMTELLLMAATAVLFSLPLTVLLAVFINYQQGEIYFPIPTVVRARELLGLSAWALFFIPLAGLPGLRYLYRIDIARVVREKVMG